IRSFKGHSRGSSGENHLLSRHSSSYGYSVTDLVAYDGTSFGTPILTSLPFAFESFASSSMTTESSIKGGANNSDPASLMRAKFLSGIDFSSTSPPFPVMSAGLYSIKVDKYIC